MCETRAEPTTLQWETRARYSLRRHAMLWTIFVVLMVLWLLGMITSYTMGGFIHLLLILAVVALAIQLITGRRPL